MAGDRIFLEGMAFYGYHGVLPEERALGQRFLVDVALTADLRPAGEADDLTLTIDYFDVHERVRAVVEGPPRLTIEAVAEAVAAALLAATSARAVTVTVRKAAPPLPGATLAASGVRIRRARPSAAVGGEAGDVQPASHGRP
jgi:dihydroneopterin aldolase